MSINVAAIPSPFIHATIKRRKNTWYTIASGNWSDPNIWMSNGRRRYGYPSYVLGGQNASPTSMPSYPTANDDVFINHDVAMDITSANAAAASITVNNLFVSGRLSNLSGNKGLTIVGDLQVTGTLDISTGAVTLALYGVNNYVNNFSSGASSSVYYLRYGDQPIMDLSYRNLGFYNIGTKYLVNNLSVAGNLTGGSIGGTNLLTLECSTYNLTVNGTTVTNGGVISKTAGGSVLFVGQYSFSSSAIQGVNFSGNPSVEFRGGLNVNNSVASSLIWNTGTTQWSFTTNSQTATFGGGITYSFSAPVSVVGNIDLIIGAGSGIMSLNQPIDHTVSGRTTTNKGTIYFNSTSSLPSFTTGTFDRTSFANTVGYTMGASITLPYTSYWSLLVSNTGTKVPVGNTTLLGNLLVNNSVSAAGTFDVSTFDLTVTGTTTPSIGTLKKTGAGNILFIGALTPTLNSPASIIDFRTGNPDVELRGGVTLDFNIGTFFSGTGTWTFTTNNQTIGGFGQIFNAPIVVAGAITVTLAHQGGNTTAMQIPSLNGTISTSKFLIGGTGVSILYFTTTTVQMPVGIFDHSTNAHTIGWNFDGDYTLPYTTFNGGLFIGGTGTKTAAADVALSGNLNITSTNGTFELGTFNLIVGGTTTVSSPSNSFAAFLSKIGTGSILFTGQLILTGNIPSLNLIGNPSVECRGGISFSISSGSYAFNGSPTFTFTTNNQSITTVGTYNFPYNILISGAITLTNATANLGLRMTGTLNGNNAASTFDNRGRMEYQATQQPMLTGALQTNLAANTFLYNAAGNQDVKGTTYRTLTLAGSGIKTLQGNVVVATLYTLTPPATLNTNGFTRT